MTKLPAGTLSKVPEFTLGFWVIKVLAMTLGVTGGDAVTRRRANFREVIPSLPVLGHDRRDDNLGYNDGGFRRSFARHPLFRRIVDSVRGADCLPRRMALVGGLHLRQYRL